MVTTCIVAPLALAGILGFAFGHSTTTGAMPIGVVGVGPALTAAAAHASHLPSNVSVHLIAKPGTLKDEVASGTLAGGVIVSGGASHLRNSDLLIPMVSPGAAHTRGTPWG